MKSYLYLICPFVTLVICQIIKFTIEVIQTHKYNWSRLFNGSGGMPSSHTTFSSSVTMLVGYTLGFDHPIFAVSLIFMLIVSYDAMGLRLESEKQAQAINMMFEKFEKGKWKTGYQKLKEELGHQPLEVLVGLLLGTFSAFLFSHLFF